MLIDEITVILGAAMSAIAAIVCLVEAASQIGKDNDYFVCWSGFLGMIFLIIAIEYIYKFSIMY